jgi:threonine aldolase
MDVEVSLKTMFASDNSAPACPGVLKALGSINSGHVYSYGNDNLSQQAHQTLADLFGVAPDELLTYLVPNGTGANVVSLSGFLRPWDGVIGTTQSHITEDECGALEGVRGIKIYHLETKHGKMTPDQIESFFTFPANYHRNNPRAISLTQSTELGTVYTPQEIWNLVKVAKELDAIVHIDGARLSNAVVALSEPGKERDTLRDMTIDAGVGIVSLGITKNGGMFCDCIVIFPKNLPQWAQMGDSKPWNKIHLEIKRSQKQALSLFSKNRYAAAQVLGLFTDNVWIQNARRANQRAQQLAQGIQKLTKVQIVYPPQVNGVWVRLPRAWVEPLQTEFGFYVWEDPGKDQDPVIRLMCSWDTSEEDVDRFLSRLQDMDLTTT